MSESSLTWDEHDHRDEERKEFEATQSGYVRTAIVRMAWGHLYSAFSRVELSPSPRRHACLDQAQKERAAQRTSELASRGCGGGGRLPRAGGY